MKSTLLWKTERKNGGGGWRVGAYHAEKTSIPACGLNVSPFILHHFTYLDVSGISQKTPRMKSLWLFADNATPFTGRRIPDLTPAHIHDWFSTTPSKRRRRKIDIRYVDGTIPDCREPICRLPRVHSVTHCRRLVVSLWENTRWSRHRPRAWWFVVPRKECSFLLGNRFV